MYRAAASTSGSRFYYLKGAAAMLEIALIQYAMQKVVAKVSIAQHTVSVKLEIVL